MGQLVYRLRDSPHSGCYTSGDASAPSGQDDGQKGGCLNCHNVPANPRAPACAAFRIRDTHTAEVSREKATNSNTETSSQPATLRRGEITCPS